MSVLALAALLAGALCADRPQNLIRNGGAEDGTGFWSTSGDYVSSTSQATSGSRSFSIDGSGSQVVSLSSLAGDIDANRVDFYLSCQLLGSRDVFIWETNSDPVECIIQYRNSGGSVIKTTRSGRREGGWDYWGVTDRVPVGARSLRFLNEGDSDQFIDDASVSNLYQYAICQQASTRTMTRSTGSVAATAGFNYQNDMTCDVSINPSGLNGRIRFTFNYLRTESCCDIVRIYDGACGSGQIRAVSGSSTPSPVVSSSNTACVRFTSDYSEAAFDGFSLDYQAIPFPVLSSVSPQGGRSGTRIRIEGSNFGSVASDVSVTVDGNPCAIVGAISNTVINCDVPGTSSTGAKDVHVTRLGVRSTTPRDFIYIDLPTITSVSPPGGITTSSIEVRGNFGGDKSQFEILFGSAACTEVGNSVNVGSNSWAIVCRPPAGSGTVDVTARRFGIAGTSSRPFTYISVPTLTSLAPIVGTTGTVLDIRGTGFGDEAASVSVSVSGSVCNINSLVSSTQVLCTAPVRSNGDADVRVSRYDVESTDQLTFTYAPTPSISSLTPAGGLPGDRVLISGSGFPPSADNAVVTVGGLPCASLIFQSSTGILCDIPALAPGPHRVSVSYYALDSVDNVDYLVLTRPTVASISPPGGALAGSLEITGTEFGTDASVLSVTVGGEDCGSVSVNGAGTVVTCDLGSVSQGSFARYPVVVTRFETDAAQAPTFNYIVPSVDSIDPPGGISPLRVTISGVFGDVSGGSPVSATVGGLACANPDVTSTTVVCDLPATPPGDAEVVVTHYVASTGNPSFLVVPAPLLSDLVPEGGLRDLLAPLTIRATGTGADEDRLSVTINGVDCPVRPGSLVPETLIQCDVPAGLTPGLFDVVLSRFNAASLPLQYRYIAQPVIATVDPEGGQPGDTITVGGTLGTLGCEPEQFTVTVGGLDCGVSAVAPDCLSLDCTLPPGTGTQAVALRRYETEAPDASLEVTYVLTPVVDSIEPPSGQTGTVITIQGASFGADVGVLEVTVGGIDCPIAELLDADTRFTCTIPAGSGKFNDVIVSRFGKADVAPHERFRYVSNPVVTEVIPDVALPGQVIAVLGEDFEQEVAFTVGGQPCVTVPSSVNVDGSLAQCTFPTGLADGVAHDVEASQFGFDSQGVPPTVVAVGACEISAVTPPNGPVGETIRVEFDCGVSLPFFTEASFLVRVGARPCVTVPGSFQSTGSVFLDCTVPSNQPGLFDVILYPLGNLDFPSTEDPHETYEVLSTVVGLSGIEPTAGQPGTIITIQGGGFGRTEDLVTITIDGTTECERVPGSLNTLGTEIQCIVPALTPAGQFGPRSVSLSNSIASSTSPVPFTYLETPVVESVSPLGGGVGTIVQVDGQNFGDDESRFEITVGGLACQVEPNTYSPTSVECRVLANSFDALEVRVVFFDIPAEGPFPTFLLVDIPVPLAVTPLGGRPPVDITISGQRFGTDESVLSFDVGGFDCPIVVDSLAVDPEDPETSFVVCTISPSAPQGVPVEIVMSRYDVQSARPYVTFESVQQPTLDTVSPPGGQAGETIVLTGTDFGADQSTLAVTIGGVAASLVPGSLNGIGTQVLVVVPSQPDAELGPQPVVLSRYGVEAPEADFAYIAIPRAVSVEPQGGLANTLITVTGDFFGLDGSDTVTVGSSECTDVTPFGGSSLVCRLAASVLGPQNVVVSRYGLFSAPPYPTYTFISQPVVSSLSPLGGVPPLTLEIEGSSFSGGASDALVVTIGPDAVPCEIVTGSLNAVGTMFACLLSTMPDLSPAEYNVTVSRFALSAVGPEPLAIVEAPTVASILPEGGQSQDEVVITGTGFGDDPSALTVLIGSNVCSITDLAEDGTELTCTVPDGFFGAQPVVVSLYNAPSTEAITFSYVSAPSIFAVEPEGGQGGDVVTVTGLFGTREDSVMLMIGGALCPILPGSLAVDGTSVRCAVPPAPAGAADLSAQTYTVPSQLSSVVQFLYVDPPEISDVSPPGGQAGTELTILGSGLGSDEDDLVVTVAGAAASIVARSLNSIGTSVRVIVPALPGDGEGVYPVVVARFGVPSVTPASFEGVTNPEVTAVVPAGGLPGERITVTGRHFGADETHVAVTVGGQACTPVSFSAGAEEQTVECDSPQGILGVQDVVVTLFSEVASAIPSPVTFEAIITPVVSRIDPAGGNPGRVVTLEGRYLGRSESNILVEVLVETTEPGTGDTVIEVTQAEIVPGSLNGVGERLQFVVPIADEDSGFGQLFTGTTQIRLSHHGVPAASQPDFEYILAPLLTAIEPEGGEEGEIITVSGLNFGSEATVEVSVGGSLCPILSGSLETVEGVEQIQCKVPSGQLGPARVIVSSYGVESRDVGGDGVSTFTYVRRPFVLLAEVVPDYFETDDASAIGLDRWRELVPREQRSGGTAGQVVQLSGTDFGKQVSGVEITIDGLACQVVGNIDEFGEGDSALQSLKCIIPEIDMTGAVGPLCEDSASPQDGVKLVSIVLRRFKLISNGVEFFYVESLPTIDVMAPRGTSRLLDAGQLVDIQGSNFGRCVSSVAVLAGQQAEMDQADLLGNSLSSSGDDSSVKVIMPAVTCTEDCTRIVRVRRYSAVSTISLTATYYSVLPPVLVGADPAGGSAGTLTRIYGDSFGDSPDDLEVTMGGRTCQLVEGSLVATSTLDDVPEAFANATQSATCVTPPFETLGQIPLNILRYGVPTLAQLLFEYVQAPQLLSITPLGGRFADSVAEADLLTLVGRDFGGVEAFLEVTVGGRECVIKEGTLNAAGTKVQCYVPRHPVGTEHSVELAAYGVPSQNPVDIKFQYVERPLIEWIEPEGGQMGDVITVYGQNLGSEGTTEILIGPTTCTLLEDTFAIEDSGESLQCRVEADLQGSQDVTLVNYLVDAISDSEFQYVEAPVLKSVEPEGGLRGSILTVRGTAFGSVEEDLQVLLGRGQLEPIECQILPNTLERDSQGSVLLCEVPNDVPMEYVGRLDVFVRRFQVDSETLSEEFYLVDRSKVNFLRLSSGWGIVIITLALIGAVLAVAMGIGIWYYRDTDAVRISTPLFAYLIVFGALVGFLAAVSMVGEPTDFGCQIRLWLQGGSFAIIYSTLFAKTWRLWRIFDNKKLRRVIITDLQVLRMAFTLMAMYGTGLFLWSVKDPMERVILYSDPPAFVCDGKNTVVYTLGEQGWRFFLMVSGVWLCWSTRNVLSRFNESKDVAFVLYQYFFISVLVTPLLLFLPQGTTFLFVLQPVSMILILYGALGVLYGKKLWMLMKGDEPDQLVNATTAGSRSITATEQTQEMGSIQSAGASTSTPATDTGIVWGRSATDTDVVML